MNLQELRSKLAFLTDDSQKSAVVYLLMKSSNEIGDLRRADIDNKVQNELCEKVIGLLKKEILDSEGLSLLNLSSADERKNVLYEYDLAEPITGLAPLATVLTGEQVPVFAKGQAFSDIQAVITVVANSSSQLAVYQKAHPINVLKKDRCALLRGSSSRLNRLDKDILLFPSALDFLQIEDSFLINNLKLLESSFGFFEVVDKCARSTISVIENRSIVEDTGALTKWLKNKTIARKLAKLADNSPVLQKKIPLNTVVEFTKTHPSLKHVFKYSDDGKIILKSKKTITHFINLLNDDYLTSDLTELYYTSLAKDGVEAEEAGEG